VLHGPFFQHAGNHDVIDLTGTLAGDHQTGLDLPQFDAVGHIQDAVQHPEAGIGEVEDSGLAADAESGGNSTGGGRLELLTADTGVDQGPDLVGSNAGGQQHLSGSSNGAMGERITRFPPATFADAGQCLKLSRCNAQVFVQRFQPCLKFGRGNDYRCQLISQGLYGNFAVLHR